MEDLRHQLLQAELKRIEDCAEANSFAIMNKADALLAAHTLCQRINEIEPGICEFSPSICYTNVNGGACEILIHTYHMGDVFLSRCATLGLTYEVEDDPFNDHHHIAIDGFKNVRPIIRTSFLARREILDAAA